MGRSLNGKELADFIKERQAKQVRALRQTHKIFPKLVILKTPSTSKAIDVYVNLKKTYGEDILIDTEIITIDQNEMIEKIHEMNADDRVHGIIVQLPLEDVSATDEILGEIDSRKDVDNLGEGTLFTSATAEAVDWLLAGYGVDLKNKNITIVGRGRLVGGPLEKLWSVRGYNLKVLDEFSENRHEILKDSEIIVTATGDPRSIKTEDVSIGAVVVDAGTASENGVLVGDVSEDVRQRTDVSITPVRGGVGPLTVAVLFDHVIQATQKNIVKIDN